MKKKWADLMIIILLCGCIFFSFRGVRIFIPLYKKLFTDYWKEYTQPLDKETQKYLCEVFDVLDKKRCKPSFKAYAFDFKNDLWKYTHAGNLQTIEEWDRVFGQYKGECEFSETFVSDGGGLYYRCYYDFAGDGYAPVLVFFSEDGTYRHHVLSGRS